MDKNGEFNSSDADINQQKDKRKRDVEFSELEKKLKSDIKSGESISSNKFKDDSHRFHSHFEAVPIPTYIWQKSGEDFVLKDFNAAASEITKGKIKEFLGCSLKQMYRKYPEAVKAFFTCYENKTTLRHEMEYYFQTLNESRDLVVTYCYVPHDMVLVHTEDVTKINQFRRELIIKNRAVESQLNALLIMNMEGKITYANPSACELFGLDDTFKEKDLKFLDLWDSQKKAKSFLNKLASGQTEILTMYGKWPDSSVFEAQVSGNPVVDKEGNTLCLMASIIDRSEINLTDRALCLAHISMENSGDGIVWLNETGDVIYANKAAGKMLGYDVSELTSLRVQELINDINPDEFYKQRWEIIKEKGILHSERQIIKKDGDIVPLEVTSNYVNYNDSEFLCLFFRDVTKKKKLNQERKKVHEIYRKAIQNTKGVPYQADLKKKRYNYFGEEAGEIFEMPASDITPEIFSSMIREIIVMDSDAPQDPVEYHDAFVEGKFEHYHAHYRIETGSGKEKWLSDNSMPIRDEETGEVTGSFGILRDITEQIIQEKEHQVLKRLALLLNRLFDIDEIGPVIARESRRLFSHDAFWFSLYDEKGHRLTRIYREDTLEGESGPHEIPGHPEMDLEKRKPSFLEGKPLLINREKQKPDEKFKPFGHLDRISSSLMFAPIAWEGKVIAVISVQSYQKDRYNQNNLEFLQTVANHCSGALMRLKTMEAMAIRDRALHNALSAMVIVDMDGIINKVNHVFCMYWNLDDPCEAEGHPFSSFWIDEKKIQEGIRKIARTGEWGGDLLGKREDDLFDAVISGALVKDEKGDPVSMVFNIVDITERRLADRALDLSRLCMDTAPDPVLWIQKDGMIFYANQAAFRVLGYSYEEFHKLKPWDLDIHIDRDGFRKQWKSMREHQYMIMETEYRCKSGELLWCELSLGHIEREGEEFCVIILRDLTERKDAEGLIRKADKRYRLMVENADEGIAIVNYDGVFLMMNPSAAAALGGVPRDFIGKTQWDIFPKEKADRQMKIVRKAIDNRERISDMEYPAIVDGEKYWCNVTIQPIVDEDEENVSCAQIMIYNVTELKKTKMQMEKNTEEIRQTENLYKAILKCADSALCKISPEWFIEWANSNLAQFFLGIPEPDLLNGRRFKEFFSCPESFHNFSENALRKLRQGEKFCDEIELILPDGSSVTRKISIVRVDPSQTAPGYVATICPLK
mgnify:CR=1 FL=1